MKTALLACWLPLPASMKLRQLQCLCVLAESGFNLSRAAMALHMTQPAMSKQLRHLEEALGLSLLRRHSGRVLGLTEWGERTLVSARQALRHVDNIRSLANEGRGVAGGQIVVATSHTQAKYALLPVLPGYGLRYPGVKIAVRQADPAEAVELVRQSKATFGLISLLQDGDDEVLARPLRSSRLVLIARPGHPLLQGPGITLEAMAQHPLVLTQPSALSRNVLRSFDQAGLDVEVAVQALNSDMAKDYVVAGLGFSLIPSFALNPDNDRGFECRDAGDLFDPVVTSLLLRRHGHMPPYAQELLALIDPSLDRQGLESLIFGR
jgi:LysR family transcriptional regulator, cys regulon transcriptional activator